MDLNRPIVQWGLLIFLAFIWGSSFILMKKGLLSFTWDQVASLRILISFLVLSPIIAKKFKKIQRNQWWRIFVSALLGSGIPAYLFPLAQTQVSSALTGMLNSLVPLFTVLIGLFFFRLTFRWLKLAGVMVGLIGAIGLLSPTEGVMFENSNLSYASLIILATIMYATNINFIKNFLVMVKAIDITAFGFLFTGPIALIHLLFTDFAGTVQRSEDALLHLFYIAVLAVFGTVLAVILFNLLIKNVSAVFSSSVTYIIPIFAILWGMIDQEKVETMQLFYVGVILIGVYIVNKDNKLEKPQPLPEDVAKK